MKTLLLIFLLSVNLCLFAKCHSTENEWQDRWLLGLEMLDNREYEKAKEMFASAVSKMSEDDLQQTPDVLIYLAQANYMIGDFDETSLLTKKLLASHVLSDQQMLICGNLEVSSLWNQGNKEKAIEAYSKYIINSPIVPKCYFKEDKIVVKNVPSCSIYNKSVKTLLTNEFCNNQEDFHEYGDVWVFNVTKKCQCKQSALHLNSKKLTRTPEVIRACCNTCSMLAVGSVTICSRFPNFVCKTACTLFIELLRQICESCCYNGGYEDKCWEKFSFWKDDFHDRNPACPHPNDMI